MDGATIGLQAIPPGMDLSAGQFRMMQQPSLSCDASSSSAVYQGQQQGAPAAGASNYGALASSLPPELQFDSEVALLGRSVLADFLRATRAYDVCPDSNKVVVLDTAVPVRLAFYALVEHDTPCAPLWDSARCCFTGLMTTSDIVDIMRIFYTPGTGAPASAALSELTIAGWRAYAGSMEGLKRGLSSPDFARHSQDVLTGSRGASVSGGGKDDDGGWSGKAVDDNDDVTMGGDGAPGAAGASSASSSAAADMIGGSDGSRLRAASSKKRKRRLHSRLISIDPEDNLLAVSQKLRKHRIHHMPVLDVDQSAVVAVLSHRHLLQHILNKFTDSRRLFTQPLYSLGVGSFDDVVVVPETASVISVLNVLAERRISSVPIVNSSGQVIDVYSRDDVAFLANDPTLMVLDAPVGEVRRAQVQMMGPSSPLVTCHRYETLHRCLELFAATQGRCERLVCVDEHNRCTGVVSLSDIFAYLANEGPIAIRASAGSFHHAEPPNPAPAVGLQLQG